MDRPEEPRLALVVEDSTITGVLIAGVIEEMGFEVERAQSAPAAIEILREFDADLAVLDIDLGTGPSGFEVVRYIQDWLPWTAILIITSFRAPRLVEPDVPPLTGIPYLVKSDLKSPHQIEDAVNDALSHKGSVPSPSKSERSITPGQADVLRLLARGLSNEMIAEQLNITERAAQHSTRRLYRALGLDPNDGRNSRVSAARLYNEGLVEVRRLAVFGSD